MNAEIERMQRMVMDLLAAQRAYLNSKPTQFLLDLAHECNGVRFEHEDISYRTAAHINHAAAFLTLEQRGIVRIPIPKWQGHVSLRRK